MEFRKAAAADLQVIARLYDAVHTAEESGGISVGWIRGIYPTEATAEAALERDDLFVETDGGIVVGTAIINQQQPESYRDGSWSAPVPDREVMVLHTLVIDPALTGKGYGKSFVSFYESYAAARGCRWLRIDTQEKNRTARALYKKLEYREIGIVPCEFNGIENVRLVLLEKSTPENVRRSGERG